MKYKVGDKAKIRKNLKINVEYDGVNVNEEMTSWRNEEVTISEVWVDDNGYGIKEDDGYFLWTDSMFEDAMTNADRIRAMSDEELADFLKETVRSYGDNLFSCYECFKENECSGISHCSKFITWLKQPIKK